jgi:hypothetical protein
MPTNDEREFRDFARSQPRIGIGLRPPLSAVGAASDAEHVTPDKDPAGIARIDCQRGHRSAHTRLEQRRPLYRPGGIVRLRGERKEGREAEAEAVHAISHENCGR